jgi:hypothetical protein
LIKPSIVGVIGNGAPGWRSQASWAAGWLRAVRSIASNQECTTERHGEAGLLDRSIPRRLRRCRDGWSIRRQTDHPHAGTSRLGIGSTRLPREALSCPSPWPSVLTLDCLRGSDRHCPSPSGTKRQRCTPRRAVVISHRRPTSTNGYRAAARWRSRRFVAKRWRVCRPDPRRASLSWDSFVRERR